MLLLALPEGYQEVGNELIRQAGRSCGIVKEDQLQIDWKVGRIVVTVSGEDVFVSTDVDDDDVDNDVDCSS